MARGEASGAVDILVQEGNLLVGYISSESSIELEAPGSILDAFPSFSGLYVNVFTSATASPGNVHLIAGDQIGSSTAPLTVDIRVGELTSISNSHTWIHTPTHLSAREMVSTTGNIRLTGGANLSLDSIRALNGHVTITAQGSILDFDSDADADIEAITITLTSANGSIGATYDDLEVDTEDSANGRLSAFANQNIYVTEKSGRLNIQYAQSQGKGDVRISTTETSAAGEDIVSVSGGFIGAADGDVILNAADDLTLNTSISARNVYLRGDYRNRDSAGSNVTINNTVSGQYAEITTDDDADTVVIASVMMVGFVIRVAKGDDDVTGGNMNDQIYGGPGVDILRGGDGDDLLDAGSGVGDQLYGGAGNDRIIGSDDGN